MCSMIPSRVTQVRSEHLILDSSDVSAITNAPLAPASIRANANQDRACEFHILEPIRAGATESGLSVACLIVSNWIVISRARRAREKFCDSTSLYPDNTSPPSQPPPQITLQYFSFHMLHPPAPLKQQPDKAKYTQRYLPRRPQAPGSYPSSPSILCHLPHTHTPRISFPRIFDVLWGEGAHHRIYTSLLRPGGRSRSVPASSTRYNDL
jgi:hypothetical protein